MHAQESKGLTDSKKKKENEKMIVHVTLLKPFEWNQKREVKIKFKTKISYCESALYVIPGTRL